MTKIREKLKESATDRLESLVERGSEALAEICAETNISVPELARLITGGRTESLTKTLIARLVRKAEGELVDIYNAQHTLPMAEDERNAA